MNRKLLLLVFLLAFVAACSGGDYVVKINDTKLTKESVQAEMAALSTVERLEFRGPAALERFVEELAKKEVFYLELKKRGLDQDAAVKKMLEDANPELKKAGVGQDSNIQRKLKNLLVAIFISSETGSSPRITAKEMKDYYDQHQGDFSLTYEVKLGRIVVKNNHAALEVYHKLRAGMDFAKVASLVSLDKETAKSGGDLGYFNPFLIPPGKFSPELLEMIFILNKGIVGGPAKLDDGIHILKATDIKGDPNEFEKVKSLISRRIITDKLMESLKKNYKVIIDKGAVAKLAPLPTVGGYPAPGGKAAGAP
ncbi:MAG: peptidylprolyl isomerase [Syntrophales bacterium]